MAKSFDLVVIGTGTAALTVAYACREAGWQVAVIDSRPFGGTCVLRGCDPKKVLVGAAEVIDWSARMKGKGIVVERMAIAWPELMRFKRTFTDPVPKAREEGLGKAGIAAFHGRARFVGPKSVAVGDDILEARFIAVAAGARPASLKIPGENYVTTSEQFLELDALPRRIVFIGGGYISMEFAHVAARAGASATILHRGVHVLDRFDSDLADRLAERTRELGVDVQLEMQVEQVELVNGTLKVHASGGGKAREFEADLVVHGAGRVPEIDDMELDEAGVDWSPRGVKVNQYLQSPSNPAVYAAGDAAASGGPPLTPVAGYEGGLVAANLLEGNHQTPNYLGIPSVVYTVPPLAAVGLDERAARDQGLKFRISQADTSGWYSSRRVGEKYSGYKVLVEESTDRILGAHLLGPHAEEHINLFALAIHTGLKAGVLKETVFAYPTLSSNTEYMIP